MLGGVRILVKEAQLPAALAHVDLALAHAMTDILFFFLMSNCHFALMFPLTRGGDRETTQTETFPADPLYAYSAACVVHLYTTVSPSA